MRASFIRRAVAVALISPVLAHAGGLYLYEVATSDLGFAGAGTAARAEDASTVYSNPAGMTRLSGNQLSTGAQLLYGGVDYSVNANSQAQQTFGGGSPGNVVGWMPGATDLSPYVVKFIAMACQFGWGYPLCKYVIFR